jgi:hypothetical protein
MFETIAGIFGSILSGGATGLLGVGIQRIADYKNKKLDIEIQKQKFEQERALRELDAKIMEQEWAARTKVAQVEAEGKREVADAEAFAASFKLEPVRYSEGVKPGPVGGFMLIFLDFLRGIVRPGLTVYLCVLTTLIYLQARELLNKEDLTSEQALGVESFIINTILYLTTTCVLWWFGTRNRGTPPELKK